MFTIEQIQAAHSKVKSGADFPNYIHEIKKLGVSFYEVFVEDGHANYYHANKKKISSPAKYAALPVANKADAERFELDLRAHQAGKTTYPSFCNDCARTGIEKWLVSIEEMTCTYYDKAGNEILLERIPR